MKELIPALIIQDWCEKFEIEATEIAKRYLEKKIYEYGDQERKKIQDVIFS